MSTPDRSFTIALSDREFWLVIQALHTLAVEQTIRANRGGPGPLADSRRKDSHDAHVLAKRLESITYPDAASLSS